MNALEKYQAELGPLAYWSPFPESGGVYADLREAITSRNDPSDWLAFAAQSGNLIWQGLPAEAREWMLGLSEKILNEILDVSGDIGKSLGSASESIPIIGAIIKALIETATVIEKVSKENDQITSDLSFNLGLSRTISKYARPDQWVAQAVQVENYLAMTNPHVALLFRVRPVIRQTEKAQRILLGKDGAKDWGWCGDGRLTKCPTFIKSGDMVGECTYQDKGDTCKRYSAISALFYPYWCPAYRPGQAPARGTNEANPNEILISRQLALLSNPAANLQARGAYVREVVDRFAGSWKGRAKSKLVRLDSAGNALETSSADRLTVDASKRPNYSPGANDRARFYFRSDGVIAAYAGDDPTRWGVPPLSDGPPAQPGLGISVAAYNAVVGSSAAFFAGRAAILRNGPVLRAMLQSVDVDDLDPEVRDAVTFSAEGGVMQPAKKPLIFTAAPSRVGIVAAIPVAPKAPRATQPAAGRPWWHWPLGALAVATAVAGAVLGYKALRGHPVRLGGSPHPSGNPAICGARYGTLTARQRARLSPSAFGLPKGRRFPMPDAAHARVAKARAAQARARGTLSRAEKAQIDKKADRILAACRGR